MKNTKNPYLNHEDDSHLGANFFREQLNFSGRNAKSFPLPQRWLQKYLLPPKIANINGSMKSIIPSHAKIMLKNPSAKYTIGHPHK